MLVVSQILCQHNLYACFICIFTVGLGSPANLFSYWAQKYVQPALFKHLRISLLYVREGFTNYEALHYLCVVLLMVPISSNTCIFHSVH